MYEMLEIVKNLLLLMGLLYFAWQDYHTRYIGIAASVIVAIIGIALRLWIEKSPMGIFASMLIGIGLIIAATISNESIGIGDGILFLVSGCYLEVFQNMILFVRTIFLTGGFAILCMVIKKTGRKVQIPLAPFMLVAYVTTFLN